MVAVETETSRPSVVVWTGADDEAFRGRSGTGRIIFSSREVEGDANSFAGFRRCCLWSGDEHSVAARTTDKLDVLACGTACRVVALPKR